MKPKSTFYIQLTGLSAAGKTTLCERVQADLEPLGYRVAIVDGDQLRTGLSKALGFDRTGRLLNLMRAVQYARSLEADVVLLALMNPYAISRAFIRQQLEAPLVWVRCDLSVLVQRDPKGLYRRAMLPEGHPEKINDLTGVNEVFETPGMAELVLDTDLEDEATCTKRLSDWIQVQYKRRSSS